MKSRYDKQFKGEAVRLSDEIGVSSYAYTYRLDGNQVSKTDHKGNRTDYVYDKLGRLATETASGGETREYVYNRYGKLYCAFKASEKAVEEKFRWHGVHFAFFYLFLIYNAKKALSFLISAPFLLGDSYSI